MSTGTLTKVTAKSAGDICKLFDLDEEARPLLKDGMTPRAFFDLLIEKKQLPVAVRFLAFALPKREAVWWACLCARQAYGPKTPDVDAVALQAAENWVIKADEEWRRAAEAAAEATEYQTPAGLIAFAAYGSGGSMGPVGLPAVPPPENLTPGTVAGAIALSAALEPEKMAENLQRFLKVGMDVANGVVKWPATPPAAPVKR